MLEMLDCTVQVEEVQMALRFFFNANIILENKTKTAITRCGGPVQRVHISGETLC